MDILIHVLQLLASLGITLADVHITTWPSPTVPASNCVAWTGHEGHVIACPSNMTVYVVAVAPR